MRNTLLLPTNQIYKQLKCKEYLRISVKKAKKKVGGWRALRYRDTAVRVGWARISEIVHEEVKAVRASFSLWWYWNGDERSLR